ncbi:MAG TPA: TetR/AcrR family transcriptional regulator [Candidatus Collinsella stercoripullorum]|nr:TetR/AcrR family transcriptional regulator [Candidatus Collinsella stercoripullorum]
MARNKYPEETVKRILDVAEELFMTRGYERTTMADIVDGLGGLTKGAVYHHFKSKEDIFEAVFERANRPVIERIERIMDDRSLTGHQKLLALAAASSDGPSAEMWRAMRLSADPVRHARILAREYADVIETAHRYIEPVIREGIADGSIACAHPREAAEAMMLLSNLWVVPLFCPLTEAAEYGRRVEVFMDITRMLGIDLSALSSLEDARMWGEDGTPPVHAPAGEGPDGCTLAPATEQPVASVPAEGGEPDAASMGSGTTDEALPSGALAPAPAAEQPAAPGGCRAEKKPEVG